MGRSMPEAYDRWLAPAVFRPFAADLAQRAARLQPTQVLEIAGGTGVLTRELVPALPDAHVTATTSTARWSSSDRARRQGPMAAGRRAGPGLR